MTTKQKATRKIKKFDFSGEDATVSLVGPLVGGSANGYQTLLTKSNRSLSEEFIKKASQVMVTLSINEYLERFFGIWDKGNQELLARSLGFITEGMDKFVLEQQEEMLDVKEVPEAPSPWDVELGDKKLEDYLTYKLQSINVMKQLNEAESIEAELANLSEEEYLQFLQDQEIVEKAFEVYEINTQKEPIQKQTKKGDENMQVDMIEKSTFVDLEKSFTELQKAFDEKQVELQKALDVIKQFEDEKKEAIQKARLSELKKAAGDDSRAEVIFAGCKDATDEVFNSIVKALSEINKNSNLFNETGAGSDESEVVKESLVTKAVKARIKTN